MGAQVFDIPGIFCFKLEVRNIRIWHETFPFTLAWNKLKTSNWIQRSNNRPRSAMPPCQPLYQRDVQTYVVRTVEHWYSPPDRAACVGSTTGAGIVYFNCRRPLLLAPCHSSNTLLREGDLPWRLALPFWHLFHTALPPAPPHPFFLLLQKKLKINVIKLKINNIITRFK